MNNSAAESTVIQLLCAAHRGGRKLTHDDFSNAVKDYQSAYRIQKAVAEDIGPVGGFKTGRKSVDEELIMAPIFSHRTRRSPAEFFRSELDLIGIELEVGFQIREPLPDPRSVSFTDMAWRCVNPLAAIEIVDTRLQDHESADPAWKLADNQINAGLVFGKPANDMQIADLSRVTARLEAGGTVLFDGPSNVPGGNAFEIFCAFARQIEDHCGGLQPGHIVITGSVTGLCFIEAGQTVRGTIEGLGSVVVNFD